MLMTKVCLPASGGRKRGNKTKPRRLFILRNQNGAALKDQRCLEVEGTMESLKSGQRKTKGETLQPNFHWPEAVE